MTIVYTLTKTRKVLHTVAWLPLCYSLNRYPNRRQFYFECENAINAGCKKSWAGMPVLHKFWFRIDHNKKQPIIPTCRPCPYPTKKTSPWVLTAQPSSRRLWVYCTFQISSKIYLNLNLPREMTHALNWTTGWFKANTMFLCRFIYSSLSTHKKRSTISAWALWQMQPQIWPT